MKILAIDIGTTYGWSLWEGECKSSGEGKFTDLATFQVDMITLINQFQPDIVVSCAPVRWHDTISKHCRLLGVFLNWFVKNMAFSITKSTKAIAKKKY